MLTGGFCVIYQQYRYYNSIDLNLLPPLIVYFNMVAEGGCLKCYKPIQFNEYKLLYCVLCWK